MIELPQSGAPVASILIVTERNPHLLDACLRSLARQLPDPTKIPTETVIALNAAVPEIRALARQGVRGALVVESDVRLGFAGGLNLARTLARGEYLLVLHDDTEVEPGWLETLLAAAREEPWAGAVGALVLNLDGSVQTAGRILWRNGGTSPVWAVGGPAPPPDSLRERRAADYTSSTSLLVRAGSFDAIGGADENYFPAIYVDTDLALGLRRLGQYVLVEPGSVVRHRWHSTTGPPSGLRHFLAERNRFYLQSKWAAELADFEAPAPESPEAVERALARAAAWRRERRAAGSPPLLPAPVSPPPRDRAAQEHRALSLEAALQRDWAAELERALNRDRAHLEVLQGEAAELRSQLEARRSELRAREADLGAIAGTRWWRLYMRLLPLLRRLTRPSGSSRTG